MSVPAGRLDQLFTSLGRGGALGRSLHHTTNHPPRFTRPTAARAAMTHGRLRRPKNFWGPRPTGPHLRPVDQLR